jgi:hypothetical protein
MAKNSKQVTNMYSPVPKKGKGRAKKKLNKHSSKKPYVGQGRG